MTSTRTLRIKIRSTFCYSLVLILAAPTLGCGSGKMHAWGEVSLDDQPIADGTIEFIPMKGTEGRESGALIKDGKYDVPAELGLLPGGTYQVRQDRQDRAPPAGPQAKSELIDNLVPAIYNSQSTLKATMAAQASENRHDFRLTKK